MYQSILLAVDGSDHSLRAAKEAARIAAASPDSQVTILYVVGDHSDSPYQSIQGANTVELDLSRRKKVLYAEQTLQAKEVYYKVEILHGRPGPRIIEYMNEHNFDLLVLGSRGLNPLQEMMLGSVSQKALNHANCPVLIVK